MELNQREKYLEIISKETLESISNMALKELEYLNGENLERFNLFQDRIINMYKNYLDYPEVQNNISKLVNLYCHLNRKLIVN